MKAVAYLRVSSASQVDGHSLDAQDRLFRELCKNRGWEVVRVYREEGKSAHVEAIARRPVFRKLLDDAARGEFDLVVVHTLDRWSRNLKVTLETLTTLGKNNVGLISISENIDYSRPEGMLFTQMLGAFAQYYSDALGNHVRKGLEQRATEGKHAGGIPFGYDACWAKGEKGDKVCLCKPEHPGGVHVHAKEGPAVTEAFRRYSTGTMTLSQLAGWLNEQGLRTRNMHKLTDVAGNLVSGPRLFTTASVRGILHNPFYAGKVAYKGKLLPGLHEALVSQEVFDLVQATLKKNSGRSMTLRPRPEREYLLKGIIRCAHCGMPMWAQTYQNGHTYYREHQCSRGESPCPAAGGSVPCHVADEQIGRMVEAIELGPQWLEQVLSIISLKDEVDRVKKARLAVQEKLRRMMKVYLDGLFPDEEYHRQKRLLELELESLVVPEANAAEEAGMLLINLPKLWAEADLTERRKLLIAMVDAVYFETKKLKSIVAIKPKPPFRPVFQVAASKAGSDIRIVNEPYKGSSVFLVETGEAPGSTTPIYS
ncbi:MAG: recombinase family protein [Chloroflexi bacterium]|nr:recombinase family protein [Chloroflexota bacterium]